MCDPERYGAKAIRFGIENPSDGYGRFFLRVWPMSAFREICQEDLLRKIDEQIKRSSFPPFTEVIGPYTEYMKDMIQIENVRAEDFDIDDHGFCFWNVWPYLDRKSFQYFTLGVIRSSMRKSDFFNLAADVILERLSEQTSTDHTLHCWDDISADYCKILLDFVSLCGRSAEDDEERDDILKAIRAIQGIEVIQKYQRDPPVPMRLPPPPGR